MEEIDGKPARIFSWDDFREYQHWMTQKIIQERAIYLGAEMGLGKTAAVLGAIRLLLDLQEVKHVLIVAPLKVADLTWPEEIAKWGFARPLRYRVVTGSEAERKAILEDNPDVEVTIINRENTVWLQKYTGVRNWPYDMLVYDEASRLKGGKVKSSGNVRKDGTKMSGRTNEFGILARMRYKFRKVVLLSGTPAPQGLVDLWGPIYICDQGVRLGDSKEAFLRRWFNQDKYTYKIEPHEWSFDEIMERIDDIFFSLKEADYLKLPPLITTDHWVDIPPEARALYDRMKRDAVLEEYDIEAVNGGVLTNKLLQIANGSAYTSDGEIVHIHDAKLDKLESIMAEAAGRPVLVGYQFEFDRDAILKRFPYCRLFKGDRDKKDWDAGRIKMLLTHPASAGHGLNLQFGGNIQVWYGLTWSLELYLQFLKRLHRSGQLGDRVFLHRILARRTMDEGMLRTLQAKDATQDRITDFVKAYWDQERLAA